MSALYQARKRRNAVAMALSVAATAIGLTGLFGYLSTVLSGWGIGYIVTHSGWDAAFATFIGIGAMAVVFFAITWNAGYIPRPRK